MVSDLVLARAAVTNMSASCYRKGILSVRSLLNLIRRMNMAVAAFFSYVAVFWIGVAIVSRPLWHGFAVF
jgi:hypothetical protein